MKLVSKKQNVLRVTGAIVLTTVLFMSSLLVQAKETVVRNETFTTYTQMQKKMNISASDYSYSPLYLTTIENYYWNFSHVGEQSKHTISLDLASNAYQNLEMLLDNGYLMDYNKLSAYAKDYKKRRGYEDAYYLILTDCLNNPYLQNKPEASVTGTTYNGRDYAKVFDADYYYNNNPDLQRSIGKNPAELLRHFVECGINQGRKGNATFDINAYIAQTDAAVLAQMQASSMMKNKKDNAADPLGKYSYSYANYYGLYLNHYNYDSIYNEIESESMDW